jgi:mono/diheme cytochrome c family protein
MLLGLRLKTWFYIVNFGLVAALLAAVVVDHNRDWAKYQKEYYALSAKASMEKAAAAKTPEEKSRFEAEAKQWKRQPVQIKQLLVNDLGRIDRCTSCHVGMDPFTNPSLTNGFAEHPYKAHPKVDTLLAKHPIGRFGCTECHLGQGLATETDAAHGRLRFIETEVLRGKEPFIQGSCARCHQNFESLKGAEAAKKGKELFGQLGCIGCHSINGQGGVISVDLGDIADKPVERVAEADFHMAHEKLPEGHRRLSVKNWILAHLIMDPMELVHNDPLGHYNAEPIAPSGMPPFYTVLKPGEAEAITAYLLSLSKRNLPHHYVVFAEKKTPPRPASAVERGKMVFAKNGCAGCHGKDGAAGWRNFNAMGPGQDPALAVDLKPLHGEEAEKAVAEMAKGREPTLIDTVGTFSRDELRKKIQDGVPTSAVNKFNPHGATPPLYMPSWKEKIKGEELEDLITYLLSIAKKEESW